jgi:hypothetical protein
MDFRTNAAELTFRRTQDSSGATLAQLEESGCVEIPGGRRILCVVELLFFAVSAGCLMAIFVVLALSMINLLSRSWNLGLSAILLAIGMVSRKIKSLLVYLYLRVRKDSLLRVLKDLPAVDAGLEDGATYKQLKMIIDDEGVCILDAARKRILIEGCAYRYVIYARDISSIEPISRFAMSGARVICQVEGSNFDFVLTTTGHGPIASLVASVFPLRLAESLAVQLTQTLFGTGTPSYAKPPPFPSVRQ